MAMSVSRRQATPFKRLLCTAASQAFQTFPVRFSEGADISGGVPGSSQVGVLSVLPGAESLLQGYLLFAISQVMLQRLGEEGAHLSLRYCRANLPRQLFRQSYGHFRCFASSAHLVPPCSIYYWAYQ